MTAQTSHASVEISGLSKAFRNRNANVVVLDNLSLEVQHGEMLVLLGPSGCGKTTLLRCVVGLEQADAGTIRLEGKIVADPANGYFMPADKRGVGMVFQNYALWPHMTVAGNVEFPLRARGMHDAIKAGRVKEALDIVQCGHLAERYPPQLSGGQQQRVALARALASRPNVMLLDEPLSNLDALLRIDLRAQLRQLHQRLGFTGIYVTHDQIEAMNLATRVVVMRAGRIEQIGGPEAIYARPANEYVAEFLGMRNRIACAVGSDGKVAIGSAALSLPQARAPQGQYQQGQYHLRSRASEISLRPAGQGVASGAPEADGIAWLPGGTVLDRLPSGDTTDYLVAFQGHSLFVEARNLRNLSKEQTVDVGFNTQALSLYDSNEMIV